MTQKISRSSGGFFQNQCSGIGLLLHSNLLINIIFPIIHGFYFCVNG